MHQLGETTGFSLQDHNPAHPQTCWVQVQPLRRGLIQGGVPNRGPLRFWVCSMCSLVRPPGPAPKSLFSGLHSYESLYHATSLETRVFSYPAFPDFYVLNTDFDRYPWLLLKHSLATFNIVSGQRHWLRSCLFLSWLIFVCQHLLKPPSCSLTVN